MHEGPQVPNYGVAGRGMVLRVGMTDERSARTPDVGHQELAFERAGGARETRVFDVPAQRFWDEYKDFQPDIIGMSGLLTLAYESMKQVVDGLKAMGVRDKVKIIIGGGQVDEHAGKYVEADAWVTDAVAGLKYALEWIKN